MSNRKYIYWACQLIGWGVFILGNILTAQMRDTDMQRVYNVSVMVFIMGVGITHSYRWLIHQWNWSERNIPALIPRVLVSSAVLSFVFVTFNTAVSELMVNQPPLINSFLSTAFITNILTFSFLFFLWNILYFAVKIFEDFKKEEIKNLELKAAKTEIELNSFRSQMNPHFMFNSLNSIRALIDEEPLKAKEAVTMLSGILRSNLLLGRKQLVVLREELDLVQKYLAIEKIRFEERLHVEQLIDESCMEVLIPPFMLQTIVENGVKHGISKRIEGGILKIEIRKQQDKLIILVSNSGSFVPDKDKEGFGVANTLKRLQLLYDDKGNFTISSEGNMVYATLTIPINNL